MSNVTFNVDEGSILTIRANDRAIIRLFNLELKCGVASTALDNRPTFDGYIYKEDEYCSEKVYNNASTLQEAVDKCNNDPRCAAIEDRWGSGKAPIALCKKYRGKRAGAGTYLLLRVRCENGWTMFRNGCYKVFREQKEWNEAKKTCEQDCGPAGSTCGQLTSIHSQDETDFIRCQQTDANQGRPDSVHTTWVGGQRTNNGFRWIDGTAFDYDNWYTNQPDNQGGNEDCLQVHSNPGQDWHDKWS